MVDRPSEAEPQGLGTKRLERMLTDLRASNERLEDEAHAKGACTHQLHPTFQAQAFFEIAAERLGITLEWEVRIEQLKAANYDALAEQMAALEEAKRQAALTQGIMGPGGPLRA